MIHTSLGQDSSFNQSIKHILLVQDLEKNCIKTLNQYTYSIHKDQNQNLIINEGIDQTAEATLLRIPLKNNDDYRFRIVSHHSESHRKTFIVNGQYRYWHNMNHSDFIKFGNNTSIQYYTIPDTLDIETLQELLQLSNGENWYETCLSLFKSFSSLLPASSEKNLENGLNHLALLTDSSPELIIELTLDYDLVYINSTALKHFPDLLDYGKSHPLLVGIEQFFTNDKTTSHTQTINARNDLYLRTCKFNKSTNTVLVFARNIFLTEEKLNQNVFPLIPGYQNNYNYITHLPNRALAESYLQQQLINQGDQLIIVFLIDLDGFKHINDTFGYFEGDRVLKLLSERLQTILTEEHFLAHWGGDEFMIICSQLDFNEIDQFCQNIIDTFQKNLVINQYEICVTASMGVSFSTADKTDIETLINNSYLALRKAKTNGKQSYQFYRKDMATESHNNLKADLKEAIEKDQFSVHYQPVINPQTGRIISLEALLRWQHPELGIIKPATFIPLAEQTGLIFSLGEFILNTVCLQHRDWQKIGIPKIPVSINFSPQQLKQLNLREKISQIFEDTGFDSHNLIIEIEESTITDDLGYAPSIFWELCELGIKFSVDNFGNRDSSFSHIQNFPFYYLKTDPSLIQTIANEQSTLRVLEALLTFSKNLKLQLVVKGVENKEQLGLLRELQCQAVQGNFIYSAMPPFQMTQVLQKHFQYSM